LCLLRPYRYAVEIACFVEAVHQELQPCYWVSSKFSPTNMVTSQHLSIAHIP